MTTVVIIIAALFALVWLIQVGLILTRPTRMKIFVSTPVLLAGIVLACQVFPEQVDHALGVVNLSDLLHHAIGVTFMTIALLWLKTLKPPHVVGTPTLLTAAAGGGLLLALVIAQWLTAPVHRIESLNDVSEWETLHGALGFTTVLFSAFMIIGFLMIGWHCIHGAQTQFRDVPVLRVSLIVMGMAVVLAAAGQGSLDIRLAARANMYDTWSEVYRVLLITVVAIFSVGLALFTVPTLTTMKVIGHWKQYKRLDALWAHLTKLYPEQALTVAPPRTPQDLAVATNRRFIEISDCLSRMRLPQHIADGLTQGDESGTRLGSYLATVHQPTDTEEGTPAIDLLPLSDTADGDRRQLLVVADAFHAAIQPRDSRRAHDPLLSSATAQPPSRSVTRGEANVSSLHGSD